MRKCTAIAAIAAILTLSVTPVYAADAPAIPPAKQALLVRLDKAMNFERMVNQITSATSVSVSDSMRQIFPEMTADQSKIISDATVTVSQKYTPKMKEVTFATYAEVLSDAELTAMVEFYEKPEGQAILEKVPQITQLSMTRMTELNVQMQKEIIATMCEKLPCPQALKDRVKP